MPIILNHFDNYPLITHKLSDYLIFKQCFEIIKQGEHLTETGLLEILSLKSYLNLGLPDKLKKIFPGLAIKNRPKYVFKGIPDPFWLSGFTSGDGTFHIVFRKSNSNSGVFARFSIHLHVRELEVLNGVLNYLNSNKDDNSKCESIKNKKIYISLTAKSANLQISKFTDIVNIIIPFFNKYPPLLLNELRAKDIRYKKFRLFRL
jgi:LAGLIDADG DNA endonuclease family protein